MLGLTGRKRGYGSLLLFFAAMLVLTLISRAYDTWTVAKIKTAYAQAKAVEIRIEGNGRILAGRTVFCPVSEGYRIEEVLAGQGETVEEGEALFCYQLSSLEEAQKRLKREVEKLNLELEKEQVSAQESAGAAQGELAAQEAAVAARELEQGIREYEQGQAEYEENLQKLKAEYELKQAVMKEELLSEQEREYESGLSGLGESRDSRDAALRAARRTVEDLEEELEELKQEGADGEGVDEGKIASVRKKLERAREDLDELEESWEEQIDAGRQDLDYIDDGQSRIQEGRTSSQVELRLHYEAQVKAEEEALREKEKSVETLQAALETARMKQQTAAKEDEKARLTREQKISLAKLNRRQIELELEEQKQELAKVELMIADGGQVVSPAAGTVLELALTPGQKTAGTELVQIGTGGLVFEGSFETEEEAGENEGQKLFPGDKVMVGATGQSGQSGQKKRPEAVIDSVNLLGDRAEGGEDGETGMGTFLAEVPDGDFLIGERTGYECVKQSGRFGTVIPLEGLRKDQDGYYCLVVRIRKSTLGEEQIAERVDLTVLAKGNQEAAVDGALYEEDPVVVDSSHMVNQGDRVRMTEEWD